jgi:pimeloyl-ACP methyl ester carboxylesterase
LGTLVDVAGPEDARALVFLHGIGATRRQWSPQMRGLASSHRAIAADLPGHGDFSGTRFTLDTAIDHVERVIDEYAGGRAMVAGVSLGGYVAIAAAARTPKKVAGLVLTGCSGNPSGVLTAVPMSMALFSRAMGERWADCANRRRSRRYGEELGREQLDAGHFFLGAQDALWQVRGRNFMRDLRTYPGPTLILNGERDAMFRLGEVYFLSAAQDARLQLVKGAGHMANLEQPERYDRALLAFARSIDW